MIDVPALQYWFTATAMFFVGSALVSLVGSILNQPSRPGRFTLLLVAGSDIPLFLGWYNAASTGNTAAGQKEEAERLRAILDKIAASTGVPGYFSVDQWIHDTKAKEDQRRSEIVHELVSQYASLHPEYYGLPPPTSW